MPRYIQAWLLLTGTIIGVGVFALPYVISEAGFLLGGAELVLLTLAALLIHLMYGDLALSLAAPHQLPGYARAFLPRVWSQLTILSSILGLTGTLVIYIILGRAFLATLLSLFWGSSAGEISFLFFVFIGLAVFLFDGVFAGDVNAFVAFFEIGFLLVLIAVGISHGTFRTLSDFHFSRAALPYGVILFALFGGSIIPKMREFFGGDERAFRLAIIGGTLIPAFLYLLFVAAVITGSGGAVSPDAIAGLAARQGSGVLFLGSAAGFVAILTSYIGIGIALKRFLVFDLNIPKHSAWLFASLVPPALVVLGVSNFISLIAFIGSFAIGFESLVVVKVWQKLPHRRILTQLGNYGVPALSAMFVLGMLYAVLRLWY